MENIDVFTSQGHKYGLFIKKFCILRSSWGYNPVLTIRRLVALFDKAQWKTTSCFFYSLLFVDCEVVASEQRAPPVTSIC